MKLYTSVYYQTLACFNKLHNSTLHFDRVMGLFGLRNSTPSGNLPIILRIVECAVPLTALVS